MDLRAIAMGVVFALMWSSAFSAARIIVLEIPPLSALTLRFMLSGGLAVTLAFALGQRVRLTRRQWFATAVFGVSQNALYLGLSFIAMQTITAGLAAIIASAMPLLVALANALVFGERMRPLGIIGLVAGFAGVAIIMADHLAGGVDPFGLTLCLLGVLALTFATLAVRGASASGNLLMVVGLQMLIGSAVLITPALATETWDVTWTLSLVAAFAWSVLVPGLTATWLWFILVGRIGATRAATFHFLNPAFGVAIAALLLGERLGPGDVVGVVVIMAGILAVQLSRQRPAL